MFDRTQKFQNRAALILTFSRYDADANRLFRQLNWKDLSTQFQIQKALMVYKSLNDLVPGYLSSKFVKRYEAHYSLRDSINKQNCPVPTNQPHEEQLQLKRSSSLEQPAL